MTIKTYVGEAHASTNTKTHGKIVNATVEILNKYYSVRCPEEELTFLQEAATFLNTQMTEIQDSGKAINLERIAIISGLNITYQFLEAKRQKEALLQTVHQQINQLEEKVEAAIHKGAQAELTGLPAFDVF